MADAIGAMAPLVNGSFSAAGSSATFSPISGHPFIVTLRDTAGTFAGSVQLERQTDGTNWDQAAQARTGPDVFICYEPLFGASYRLRCTARTAGTLTYRIEQ